MMCSRWVRLVPTPPALSRDSVTPAILPWATSSSRTLLTTLVTCVDLLARAYPTVCWMLTFTNPVVSSPYRSPRMKQLSWGMPSSVTQLWMNL
jgi:hypothetical protein